MQQLHELARGGGVHCGLELGDDGPGGTSPVHGFSVAEEAARPQAAFYLLAQLPEISRCSGDREPQLPLDVLVPLGRRAEDLSQLRCLERCDEIVNPDIGLCPGDSMRHRSPPGGSTA